MPRKPPTYETPSEWACPYCHTQGEIIPLQNEFSYSGTHCTGGKDGTHYPAGWGSPVCSFCEEEIEDAEMEEPYYE